MIMIRQNFPDDIEVYRDPVLVYETYDNSWKNNLFDHHQLVLEFNEDEVMEGNGVRCCSCLSSDTFREVIDCIDFYSHYVSSL